MSAERPKVEVRLPNGDVLIIATTKRDAEVDAAFKDAVDRVREHTRERFIEYRRSQQQAA
jgi:hypothetical protein